MSDEVASRPSEELARVLGNSERTFRLLVTAVKDYAIFMLDVDGTVQTWNEGAQRMKGWTADEIIGQNFSLFYPEDSRAIKHPQDELALARINGTYEEEGWRVRKDGTKFWAHILLTAVYDGPDLLGFAKVTQDLTEHRLLEEEREKNSKRVSEANEVLRRTLESKERFLSTLSHEMRSPIAGIIGMTELLTMEDFGEDTNEMIKSVYDSSNRLLQLLSNLLESARLEAGKLKLEHIGFSLQAVIRDALQLVSREAAKKSLQVESFCDSRLPAEICGDEYKLGQILTNLVFNAVKFTNMGSITLACNLVSETASSVVVQFSVSDTGIGIKGSDQEKLFQPFVQADDAVVRLYGGSGLGLSICKQLVELMGGRIGLKSEPGAGSTFWFEIPFDKVDCVVTDFDNDDDA